MTERATKAIKGMMTERIQGTIRNVNVPLFFFFVVGLYTSTGVPFRHLVRHSLARNQYVR